MNFRPKLVVFDLDGTLAESKQRMTADMGELLAQLLHKLPVAVMSGASFKQFETQFMPALPSDVRLERLYLFPTNAAQCYHFEAGSWRTRYDHSFSDSERAQIHKAIEEAIEEIGGIERPPSEWGELVEDRSAQITFSAIGQKAPLEKKQEWNKQNDEKRKKLREAIAKRLSEFSVSTGGLTSIDITRKGITKAYGMKRLIELTSISVSEILYVGDALQEGGNDAVVIESGVKTHQVFGPEETASLISDILKEPTFSS